MTDTKTAGAPISKAGEINEEAFRLTAIQHSTTNKEMAIQKKELEKFRKTLDDNADKFCVVQANGNKVYVGKHGPLSVKVEYSQRISSSLHPDADEMLEKNKLKKYLRQETVTIIDVEQLEADIKSGLVKAALVEELYETTKSYALKVTVEKTV